MNVEQSILSDITVYMKYAKYNPDLKRRETWEELVTRNKEMHQAKFPQLKDEIEEAYKLVYDKKYFRQCAVCSSLENPLNLIILVYLIALFFLLMIGEPSAK